MFNTTEQIQRSFNLNTKDHNDNIFFRITTLLDSHIIDT